MGSRGVRGDPGLAPAAPRDDPWRRTSGLHAIRTRRELAIVRSLWYARDAWAAERDISPGRLLPDSAIIAAARANPSGPAELAQLPTFRGPRQRRAISRWWNAVAEASVLPDADLPQPVSRADAMPPTSRWRERDPKAAARLAACRHVISTLAAKHRVLPQNLLAGDIVRRLAWEPPDPPDATGREYHVGQIWRATMADRAHRFAPWRCVDQGAGRRSDRLTTCRPPGRGAASHMAGSTGPAIVYVTGE
jgi:ribonuclease D